MLRLSYRRIRVFLKTNAISFVKEISILTCDECYCVSQESLDADMASNKERRAGDRHGVDIILWAGHNRTAGEKMAEW